MKKNVPFVALLSLLGTAACEKEPDLKRMDGDYFVGTGYEPKADFCGAFTFFLPDSILIIGEKNEPDYLTDSQAARIVDTYVAGMEERGYVRTPDKAAADLGIQLTYIGNTTHFIEWVGKPAWWWGYPGFWSPAYWGNWGYWYYSFPVAYNCATGKLLMEMVDLRTPEGPQQRLPVIWNNYIHGWLTRYEKTDTDLLLRGIHQAFQQSGYVKSKVDNCTQQGEL